MPTVYKTPSILLAALLASSSLLPAVAAAEEVSVFFCPSKVLSQGQFMRGIMCNAEACYNTGSPELSAQQRVFLEKSDQPCRSLTPQEVSDLWPKTLPAESQQAAK